MLLRRKLAMSFAGLIAMLVASGNPLAAQDIAGADTPADSQLAGTAHTADGAAIPGATLRVIQTSTGKAWVTWTDEDGKFEFPALPEGHFRAEISQLGFSAATKEVDLTSGVKTPIDLRMDVGTLEAISAPPAPPTDAATKTPIAPADIENSKASPSDAPAASNSSATTAAVNNGAAAPPAGGNRAGNGGPRAGGGGARNGPQGGPGGNGSGGGRRAFQQVGLTGQDQNTPEPAVEDQTAADTGGGGQLEQTASADAVQMIGTVAMGQMPAAGFPQPGDGGPDARGAFEMGTMASPGKQDREGLVAQVAAVPAAGDEAAEAAHEGEVRSVDRKGSQRCGGRSA